MRSCSLSGWLSVRPKGRRAFSILRPKKRYFFVLDGQGRSFNFYKNEEDYVKEKSPLGSFSLDSTTFSAIGCMPNGFLIILDETAFELEADSEKSCDNWIRAIARIQMESEPSTASSSTNTLSELELQLANVNLSLQTAPQSPEHKVDEWLRTNCLDESEREIELQRLRVLANEQKTRLYAMKCENQALREQNNLLRTRIESDPSGREQLLNAEVVRLSRKCSSSDDQLRLALTELEELRARVHHGKSEYVAALRAGARLSLKDVDAIDGIRLQLYGGDMHWKRISTLLKDARAEDSTLPTLESLTSGIYVDEFGFRHHLEHEEVAIHYAASKLYQHYQESQKDYLERRTQWKELLEAPDWDSDTAVEVHRLCLRGAPKELRSQIWRRLIYAKVQDLRHLHGKYYFRNLCRQALQGCETDSTHLKQINLDLLRTMPRNVHFATASAKGIRQLQLVLRAFALHNPTIGYCQGMNFIAAMALLILEPEDVFWLLIMLTEKVFDSNYFDANLTGALADQQVLKELLNVYSPVIAAHLASVDVDLSALMLNWFIGLFFDATPFATTVRIWDWLLCDGSHVLFKVTLVILGAHEEEILRRNDSISIMKTVKAAARLSFDADGLIQKAVAEIKDLPAPNDLKHRREQISNHLQKVLSRRQRWTEKQFASIVDDDKDRVVRMFASGIQEETSYLCAGSHSNGRITKITADKIQNLPVDFDCCVVAVLHVSNELLFASLVSGYIVAVGNESEVLWELRLADVALSLVEDDGRLLAGLANGTLAVLENALCRQPTHLEIYSLTISSAPLIDLAKDGENLVVATGCKIIALDRESLRISSSTVVACSTSSPFFEQIHCIVKCDSGIFLTMAQSTLVQLWKDGICLLLFDINFDQQQRTSSLSDDEVELFITCMSVIDDVLFVGTSEGYLLIYRILFGCGDRLAYPVGTRLILSSSSDSQSCYIPTETELNNAEKQLCRQEEHVRIDIDKLTRKLSISQARSPEGELRKSAWRQRRITPSADSAVSVLSSANSDTNDNDYLSFSVPTCSHLSMEYDDIFETYSDDDISRKQVAVRQTEKTAPPGVRTPVVQSEYSVRLELQMKMKTSMTRISSLSKIKSGAEWFMVSASGIYNDEDTIMIWKKELGGDLWISHVQPPKKPKKSV